jgi:hypothetical protein
MTWRELMSYMTGEFKVGFHRGWNMYFYTFKLLFRLARRIHL